MGSQIDMTEWLNWTATSLPLLSFQSPAHDSLLSSPVSPFIYWVPVVCQALPSQPNPLPLSAWKTPTPSLSPVQMEVDSIAHLYSLKPYRPPLLGFPLWYPWPYQFIQTRIYQSMSWVEILDKSPPQDKIFRSITSQASSLTLLTPLQPYYYPSCSWIKQAQSSLRDFALAVPFA